MKGRFVKKKPRGDSGLFLVDRTFLGGIAQLTQSLQGFFAHISALVL